MECFHPPFFLAMWQNSIKIRTECLEINGEFVQTIQNKKKQEEKVIQNNKNY